MSLRDALLLLLGAVTPAAPSGLSSRGDATCVDVAERQVCWHGARPSVTARALPSGVAPRRGWRCAGSGASRECEDRARGSSEFACHGDRCVQSRPRMPNDAEWECVDMDGVTFCHGRGDAAGIVPAPIELGWLCGDGPAGPVCVDFDADRPALAPSYRCRIVYPHGVPERDCTRAVAARVGSACDASVRCPAASSCQDGLCLPARPAPSCWFDAHCGNGAVCRWGTCQ